MKKVFKIFLILAIGLFFISPSFTYGATPTLTNVRLEIQPRVKDALSSWTISFQLPKTARVGYVEISLGGEQPSLANSTLTVSGLSGGHGIIGKTNKSCVSNCDDIKYLFDSLSTVNSSTKIVFTVNSVKNANSINKTGLSFINVFGSLYPQRTLISVASNIFLPLEAVAPDEQLIPPSATSEGETREGIAGIVLNDLFYQQGAKTTNLSAIKDLTKVSGFTLDLLGKERVTFNGNIDLSPAQAANLLTSLSSHMVFEHLDFKVDQQLMDYFKVPLAVTYYDVPFIFDPDILKDGKTVLTKDKVSNYKFFIIDNQTEVSFLLKDAGEYKLIPHFELYVNDNQQVQSENGLATFSGRISDTGAKIAISLNNQEVKDAVKSIDPGTGSFSFTVNLIPGTNLISASAESAFGAIDKITKTVQYQSGLKPSEAKQISPYNIAAIILALAIVVIVLLVHYFKKRKRRR
ncbi:MAG: hypothetical protein PHC97_03605 [Patescibacteria group bacterium]|nr:hypothetical protein [Patescibacteria group bacterium]